MKQKSVHFMSNSHDWETPQYLFDGLHAEFRFEVDVCAVVCLVPARTDTRWWHKYSMRGEIRYLRGRLKFGGVTNSAPFPSAVVIFRPPQLRLLSLETTSSSDQ